MQVLLCSCSGLGYKSCTLSPTSPGFWNCIFGINQLAKHKCPLSLWWLKIFQFYSGFPFIRHRYSICSLLDQNKFLKIIWSNICFTIFLNTKCCRCGPKTLSQRASGILQSQLVDQANLWHICSDVLSDFHFKIPTSRGIVEYLLTGKKRKHKNAQKWNSKY